MPLTGAKLRALRHLKRCCVAGKRGLGRPDRSLPAMGRNLEGAGFILKRYASATPGEGVSRQTSCEDVSRRWNTLSEFSKQTIVCNFPAKLFDQL